VVLYISGGGTQVPSVIGDPQATAQSILTNAGFKVKVVTVAGPAGSTPGTVFNQQPSSQSTEPAGTTVTIFVAATTQPTAPATSASPTPTAPATPTPTATSTTQGGGTNGGGGGNGRR
jgi:beta-lactam-binding protein with PASTA domain